jgi:cell pole-organizing protein PopZ
MSPFERDTRKHVDSPGDAPRDASTASGSSSDAEDSAAHIAELVRRTAERDARPGPPSVAGADATVEQPAITVPPLAQPVEAPATPPARPKMRLPSPWVLVAGGAVAAVLIASGFALSRPASSQSGPTSPALRTSAPPAYVVRVTDVITDCASHSHGQTKNSFETQNCVNATRSLATGRVSGRPVLFVVSRIRMASAESAASIKQVLDANGTGNLNDLLLEGKTFPGAPAAMPDSGYASVQMGAVIRVAEAGFLDGGPSSSANPSLRAAAAQIANR